MGDLTVLAERFTVVGRDHRQCRWRFVAKTAEEARELPVGLGDLVAVSRLDGASVARISVRGMGFEQMDPEEEPLIRLSVQPCECFIHDEPPGSLVRLTSVGGTRQLVRVGLESLDQPEAPVQRERRHECGRRESARAQPIGKRRSLEVEPYAVVPRPVAGGVPASHDAGV